MSFYSFIDENGMAYGSFEVFRVERETLPVDDPPLEPGWYWWPCFAGCMPESDAIGPFKTQQEAIDDARGES